MALVRFYAALIRIAFLLALVGQLKSCTLDLLGMAYENSSKGIMPYSDFNRRLTK